MHKAGLCGYVLDVGSVPGTAVDFMFFIMLYIQSTDL